FIGSQSGQGGLVMQAITLTIGVLFLMLFLYSSGIIKVTEKLKMGVFAATGAVGLMYMINFIMSFFGAAFFTLEDTSVMAIGINLVIVGVAAFNLLLDFDFIDKAAAARAPKAMEWFGAFGLMVTLIWLYIELLKLLSRLNRN
ncbi:MAG: putative YccA/Bax inhibitor family protein, partial [Salibacteraceae bacterium]